MSIPSRNIPQSVPLHIQIRLLELQLETAKWRLAAEENAELRLNIEYHEEFLEELKARVLES